MQQKEKLMSQEFKPHHYQYFEYGIKSCYDAERGVIRAIGEFLTTTLILYFFPKIFEPTNG